MGILPAGNFEATEVTIEGQKPRGVAWCRDCGRKHPRKAPCDLVEYQQGDEYEGWGESNEGRPRLVDKRHPGRFMSRQSYEKRKAEKND
jgi:hypothetical protein